MISPRKLGIAVALFCLLAGVASAGDDWHKVASLTAGGDAKEVSVNRDVTVVRIVAETGTVIINTVVVREGGKKTPHTIGAKLAAKERREITLPARTNVTGLRISDDSSGTYTVYVR